MLGRRRHLFVLLFVLGLLVVSALVIVNQPTRLGLDLKGGVQLVYQGEPTGQVKSVSGEDIDRSIEIIRQRIDTLGVSEPEVSRLGTNEISVSLPDITNAQRAIDTVGTTAQLYFYDWEPNLIGPEKAIGGHPGQQPPPAALKKAKAEWKAAGRNTFNGSENLQLIDSGAFPTAYDAALLASKQPPATNCSNCSTARPRYYLFERKAPHKLIAGPEDTKGGLYISPTGQKRPRNGIVVKVPAGTVVVSELPTERSGKTDKSAEPGWYALRDRPALSGTDITEPKQNFSQGNEPNVTFGFTEKGREAFQEVTRQIAQRGQAQAIGPVSAEQASALSGHFAVVLDNEVKTRPIINFAQNPDGIEGRTGAEISGGFHSPEEAQELATILQIGALPIDLKLISQTQVSATLGSQALHEGIKAGIIGLSLVVLFLLFYYRFLGLIATVALGAYGVIFFALIKLIPITLTLPGIAGLILTIGVAADSNIVIFERIKEEVRAGRSMSSAIAAGYRRGIATIVDANVVTLLTAFILFVLATAGVKGFAFTLGVGTIVSLLTAVVFTQALLGSMSRSRAAALAPRPRRRRQGQALALRLHGRQPLVLHPLRLHPADRRPRPGDQAAQLRHRLQVRHQGDGGAGQADQRGRGARSARHDRRQQRRGPAGLQPGPRRQRLPDRDPRAGAEPGQERQSGAPVQVRDRQERIRKHQRRADLRRTGGEQRAEGIDLLAAW